MYAHILIATDGSEVAGRALDHGLRLAETVGAKVTVVTVTEPAAVIGAGYASVAGTMIDPVPQLIEAVEAGARVLLEQASAVAKAAGVAFTTTLVPDSYPAEGIVATAASVGADLIVMGSHGRRGLSRIMLGSQTSNVLTHTKIPVLVTR